MGKRPLYVTALIAPAKYHFVGFRVKEVSDLEDACASRITVESRDK
jgi:hypothetical protein